MTKKFFCVIVAIAIIALVPYNVNLGSKSVGLSDAVLANIEALAQTEDNPIELPEVVIYCDSYAEDCITPGPPSSNGHCWEPERSPWFGWDCRWSGKTNDTCCRFE